MAKGKDASALVIDHTTPDKPEILGIAQRIGMNVADAFTGCFRVWSWAQKHTKDGNLRSTADGEKLIDAITGIAGFARAMVEVGWLVLHPDGFSVPRFDRHLALTAYKVTAPSKPRPKKPIHGQLPAVLDTPAFRRAWADWQEHRKQIKRPLSPNTAMMQLSRLARVGEAAGVRVIERSIERGWIGLFLDEAEGEAHGRRRGLGHVDAPPGKYDGVGTRCGPEAEPGAEAPPPAPGAEDPGDDCPLFAPDDPGPGGR